MIKSNYVFKTYKNNKNLIYTKACVNYRQQANKCLNMCVFTKMRRRRF